MGKLNTAARKKPATKAPGGKGGGGPAGKSPRGKSPQTARSPGGNNKPLGTSKGLFSFTSVADGCFIEQKVNHQSVLIS